MSEALATTTLGVRFHFDRESTNVRHPVLRVTSNFGFSLGDYWLDKKLNSLTVCCGALRGLGEYRGGLCKACGRVIQGDPYRETRYDEERFRPWVDSSALDPLTAELVAHELATRHQCFIATARLGYDFDLVRVCRQISGPVFP